MSQSLIKTDIGKLVKDLMERKGENTSDEEIYKYINWLAKKEKLPEVSMEQFNEYANG